MAKQTKRKKPVKKKRPVVEPCSSHPPWSMARYRTFVRSAMRRAWIRWPPRYEALQKARRKNQSANKRLKWEFQCAHCEDWFQQKHVSVDHITPWGSLTDLSHEEAWARLLVSAEQLQILCKDCHDKKTASE